MKKRLKLKWKNVIATVLIVDIIRTFGVLAFNMTSSLTMFGFVVLMVEIFSLAIITV